MIRFLCVLMAALMVAGFACAEEVVAETGAVLSEAPVPTATPEPPKHEVRIEVSRLERPVYVGTTVTLTAVLKNYGPDEAYDITWQYSKDGGKSWTDIPDSNSTVYSFKVDEENYRWHWRVAVKGR